MSRCQICGKTEFPSYKCNYCEGFFCSDHRLPPNHDCQYVKLWKERTPITTKTKRKGERVEYDIHEIKKVKKRRKKGVKKKIALVISLLLIVVYISLSHLITSKTPNQSITVLSNLFKEEPVDENTINIEQLVFEEINRIRKAHGLNELKWDDRLARIAREHSVDMAVNDYFSHDNLRGEGPNERAIKAGINIKKQVGLSIRIGIGENIAKIPKGLVQKYGFVWSPESVAKAAVDGWMNSPLHRMNILDRAYTHTGIGVACLGGVCYLTQDFI